MVPAGWLSETLPPHVNVDKLSRYISDVCGRTILPKDEFSNIELKYINPAYIQYLGKISRFVTLKNRKKLDTNYTDFELSNGSLNDGLWGLTEPNLDAYYKNLGKLNKAEHISFNDQAAKFATHCMERHFYAHLKDSRIETQEESISRHDRQKSPGPPWNFEHKTKETLLEDPKFLEFCRKAWDWLLDDEFWFLGGTALKEEVRPVEKLTVNKQRIFIPNSADFVTVTNRLCGDFNDKFTACHLKTASAVGINPFQGGWQRLRDKITKHPNMGEYDFSDYDSSLGVLKLLEVCKFRFKCFAPEHQTWDTWHRLLNCYKNIIWTVIVLVDGTLAIKPGGNPSGGANTVVDNTLVNYWSMAYAFYVCVTEEYRSYTSFNELVESALYGDDNTNSVADAICNMFTPAAYCAAVAELGMTCNPVSEEWLTIDDVTFLQADFKTFLYGVCIYHIEPSKSYESMRWSEERTPSMSLQRAVGMHRVTWSDPAARAYYTKYISYLMNRYDLLLSGVKEWECAKAGIKPDWAMAAFFTGLECKDQKDFQTSETYETCHFELQARRGKKGKKGGRPPPVPSRNTAAYKKGRRSVQQHRAQMNKKSRKGRRSGGTGSNRATVRITQAPVSTANVMSFPRQKKPFVGTHFEKLADVSGTSAFTTTTYALNPGLVGTFPWMAAIANNFEMYKFLELEFWYVQATATSTTGTVYMAFDPDAVDSAPPSSTALIDLNVKTVGSPYINLKLRIPPKSRFVKDLYIRTGSVSGTDLKTYDLGNFYISTDGCNVTSKIGALFVSYKVALISPELPIGTVLAGAAQKTASAAPTTASLFASPTTTGTILGTIAANVFTFTQAVSPVLIAWELGATTISGVTVSSSAGSISNASTVINTGTTSMNYISTLTSAVVGTTITFAATVNTGNNCAMYIAVMPTGVSHVDTPDEILFEQFRKMLRREEKLRALEDQKIERRISNLEQNEEEGLDLSDDEELYVERTPSGDVVRLHNIPCIPPQPLPDCYHEGSMASGSSMHVNAQRAAREQRFKTVALPTPTETISFSVKGKDKL